MSHSRPDAGSRNSNRVPFDIRDDELGLLRVRAHGPAGHVIVGGTQSWHEVAPYVTLTRQQNNLSGYIVNKAVWDKISAPDRASIKRISAEADKRSVAVLDTAFKEARARRGKKTAPSMS